VETTTPTTTTAETVPVADAPNGQTALKLGTFHGTAFKCCSVIHGSGV
jgi:hypothetical protein